MKEFRVCEAHGGFGMLAMQGNFSRREEPRRSGPPQSKADRRQRRWNSCACGFIRQANERTRMRLLAAWQTPLGVLVRQIQFRNI